MRIPRIYIPRLLYENSTLELDIVSTHYVVSVIRMKTKDPIILFNGIKQNNSFGEFEATLTYVSKKSTIVKVGNFISKKTESPLAIELGACIIKNDSMDWLLQKATELGVATIVPILSDFTDIKITAERMRKKLHHWQKIVINACVQSGRVSIPKVIPPLKIQLWIEYVTAHKKLVLHPSYIASKEKIHTKVKSIALLVGPEGGLADHEVDLCIRNNFETLVLGPRILRAETVPLVALVLLQYQYGDLFN